MGLGNEALVNAADLLEFFGDDPELDLVLAYVEGIRDGRRFLEAARAAAARKPVVVLRGGTSVSGSRAAASHTGAMAGRSRVFAAAARQAGLTVTTDQDEFMDVAVAFSRLPLPPGRRVAVVTSGGGWGVMCADELERKGLTLARLPSALVGQLDGVLSQYWSRGNPVDLVATVGEGLVERVLQMLLAADEVDAVVMLGVISILAMAPRMRRKGAAVCRALGLEPVVAVDVQEARRREEQLISRAGELMETYGKPVLAVDLARGSHVELREGGRYRLVVYPSPLRAVQALAHMARYAEHRRRVAGWRGRRTRRRGPTGERPGRAAARPGASRGTGALVLYLAATRVKAFRWFCEPRRRFWYTVVDVGVGGLGDVGLQVLDVQLFYRHAHLQRFAQ